MKTFVTSAKNQNQHIRPISKIREGIAQAIDLDMLDPSQDTSARHPTLPHFKLRGLPPHGKNLERNHEGPAGRDRLRDLAGLVSGIVSGLGEDRLS